MALKLGTAFATIGLKTGSFDAGMKRVQASFQTGIARMEKIAAKARIGLLLAAGGMAIAVKAAAGFEQGMARVRALTGATGSEFDALREKALYLGRTTVFSARQSAEAMSYFALAGFKADKIMRSMASTLDLAAAGQLGVAQASDIVAKIMAGMKLEADELAHTVDVLTKAFTSSNTDLLQLGEAMKYVGPVGKAAGKDIEELVSAIQVMSNAGIQATMAGTSLRNILSRLAGGTVETNKVFKRLNVEMQTATGGMRPLADVIDDINRAMKGMGEAEKLAVLMQAFGQRAGPGMAVLLEAGGDEMRAYEKTLRQAAGTAKRIAEIQLNTFQGRLVKLTSAAGGLAIAFGEQLLPTLEKITKRITVWTSALASAEEGSFAAAAGFAAIAMKAGVLLIVIPKVMAVMAQLALLTAVSGGPLTLGLVAVAAGLSAIALAAGEAAVTGKTFGDVVYDNIKALTGYTDALDKQQKQEALITKQGKASAAAYTARAYGATVEEDYANQAAAIKEAKAAATLAEQQVKAAKAKISSLVESKKKAGLYGYDRQEEVAARKQLTWAEERLRIAILTRQEHERMLKAVTPRAFWQSVLPAGVQDAMAKVGQRPKGPGILGRIGTTVSQVAGGVRSNIERNRASKAQAEAFWDAARRAGGKMKGMAWLGMQRGKTAWELSQTRGRIEGTQKQMERAKRTPEFTAIADFAKSIQSKIYDRKAVDLAAKQLETLKAQKTSLESKLVSIDKSLKKGIVGRAG